MSIAEIVMLLGLSLLIFIVLFSLNKINETLNSKINIVQGEFTKHLVSSESATTAVTKNLTELKEATGNILEVGKNIQSLQDILKPPKLRGELGELLLENIVKQILPQPSYQFSYRFQTGNVVDLAVKLKDSKLLCIDSKFPMDSIKDYISNGSKSSDELPSQFIRDVKKHIDAISNKYILPNEGTLDIALMYIPAENIYYEVILKDEKIMQYAREKHVVPVSPIGLYSYLSIILTGLKGFEVEKNAKEILSKIGTVQVNLESFLAEFNTLGTHLSNAKSKYDSSREIALLLSEKLKKIGVSEY